MDQMQEFIKAINENMPALQAQQLQERLAKVAELEEQVKGLESALEAARIHNKDLGAENEHLQAEADAVTEEREELQGRRKALEAKELEYTMAELKVSNANLRVEDHKAMVNLIFRNAEMRRSFSGTVAVPGSPPILDQYNNLQHGYADTPHIDNTETHSQE